MNAHHAARRGLSLLEMLGAVVILAIVAALIIPRMAGPTDDARRNACHTNRGEIELQTQLWRRNEGSFPAGDLSDIGADSSYFPEGLPVCPVDGTAYTINTTTGTVIGHDH